MKKRSASQSALLFSGITLGLSFFVFWGPIAFLKIPAASFVSNVRGPLWAVVLFLLGGFVPSATALALTGIIEGKNALRAMFRRALQFKIGLRWYLLILTVVLVGTSGKILINALCGSEFNFSLFRSQFPNLLPLLIAGPISEEFGWRGYLLSKLQERWSATSCSIVVGMVWAFWHLPLFYIVGTSQCELHLPFSGFLVGLVSVSVIMTWLNNNTSGSIWTAIVFHWLYTYVSQVVSSGVKHTSAYDWLEFLPYLVVAVLLLSSGIPARHTRETNAQT